MDAVDVIIVNIEHYEQTYLSKKDGSLVYVSHGALYFFMPSGTCGWVECVGVEDFLIGEHITVRTHDGRWQMCDRSYCQPST